MKGNSISFPELLIFYRLVSILNLVDTVMFLEFANSAALLELLFAMTGNNATSSASLKLSLRTS